MSPQYQLRTDREMQMSIWSPLLMRRNERRRHQLEGDASLSSPFAYLWVCNRCICWTYPDEMGVFHEAFGRPTLEIRFPVNVHILGFLYDLQVYGHQQLRSLTSCSPSWIILPSRIPQEWEWGGTQLFGRVLIDISDISEKVSLHYSTRI